MRENRRLGIDPDGSALTPRFKFERDVPLEVYGRAFERVAGA